MAYKNIEDQRAYHKRWYNKNKEKRFAINRRNKVRIRNFIREFKVSLTCGECGENHPACLEFHHLDPSKKEISIANTIKNGWAIERIKKEMDKCIVLCANCHRKLHYVVPE